MNDLERLPPLQDADDDRPALPLHSMSGVEVDRFIGRCEAALRSHSRDFEMAKAADKDDFLAAYESTIALLLEVREHYPLRAGDIDAVLAKSGYPVREN